MPRTAQDKTPALLSLANASADGVADCFVRVFHGRVFVEGPDCRMRGWFFALRAPEGEGDAIGPFRTKEEAVEAARDAFGIPRD